MVDVKPVEVCDVVVPVGDVLKGSLVATCGVVFFLCEDLWTTGVPSGFVSLSVVFFVLAGVVVLDDTTVTSLSARTDDIDPRRARSGAIRRRRVASIMLLWLSAFSLVRMRLLAVSGLALSPLLRHGTQADYSNNHPKNREKIFCPADDNQLCGRGQVQWLADELRFGGPGYLLPGRRSEAEPQEAKAYR